MNANNSLPVALAGCHRHTLRRTMAQHILICSRAFVLALTVAPPLVALIPSANTRRREFFKRVGRTGLWSMCTVMSAMLILGALVLDKPTGRR